MVGRGGWVGVRVTATDWHNGVATPLDPSMLQRRTFSSLRVSGPSLLDSGSGAGIVDVR